MALTRRFLFVDSCAVNCFALLNLDPGRELEGSRFQLAHTPSLEDEYRHALAHPALEPHIKTLLTRLLQRATSHSPPPGKSTDDELVALSSRHFVVTLDTKSPWDRAVRNVGLIVWPVLEATLRDGDTLLSILRARAPYLDD